MKTRVIKKLNQALLYYNLKFVEKRGEKDVELRALKGGQIYGGNHIAGYLRIHFVDLCYLYDNKRFLF